MQHLALSEMPRVEPDEGPRPGRSEATGVPVEHQPINRAQVRQIVEEFYRTLIIAGRPGSPVRAADHLAEFEANVKREAATMEAAEAAGFIKSIAAERDALSDLWTLDRNALYQRLGLDPTKLDAARLEPMHDMQTRISRGDTAALVGLIIASLIGVAVALAITSRW